MTFVPLSLIDRKKSLRFDPLSANSGADARLQEAYERGRSDAAAENERIWKSSTDVLFAAARDLKNEMRAAERRAFQRAAEFIARVIVEAAPAITLAAARQAIETLLEKRACAADSGAVVVTANAELVSALKARIDHGNEPAVLTFEVNDALGPAHVVTHWRDGSVECDINGAASGIANFISRAATPQDGDGNDATRDAR